MNNKIRLLAIFILIYSPMLFSWDAIDSVIKKEVAIKLAKNFLMEEQNKDLRASNCFINKAEYKNDEKNFYESYWSIMWSGNEKNKWNCVAEMRVFNNGEVIRVVGY